MDDISIHSWKVSLTVSLNDLPHNSVSLSLYCPTAGWYQASRLCVITRLWGERLPVTVVDYQCELLDFEHRGHTGSQHFNFEPHSSRFPCSSSCQKNSGQRFVHNVRYVHYVGWVINDPLSVVEDFLQTLSYSAANSSTTRLISWAEDQSLPNPMLQFSFPATLLSSWLWPISKCGSDQKMAFFVGGQW